MKLKRLNKLAFSLLSLTVSVAVVFSSLIQFHHHHDDGSIFVGFFHEMNDDDDICSESAGHSHNDFGHCNDCDDDHNCGLHISEFEFFASSDLNSQNLVCDVAITSDIIEIEPTNHLISFLLEARDYTYLPPPLYQSLPQRAPPCLA